MPRGFQPSVLTANDLLAGDVVYLATDGAWTRNLGEARLFVEESAARRCLARAEAAEDRLIGPYLVAAGRDADNRPTAAHFREAFRATGPSNYPHGKQAGS